MPIVESIIHRLTEIVGIANVLTKIEDVLPYGFDGTATFEHLAAAVVFPQNTAQVAACVKLAAEHKISIVTRGSGTGLSGGSVPSPAAVLSTGKMSMNSLTLPNSESRNTFFLPSSLGEKR